MKIGRYKNTSFAPRAKVRDRRSDGMTGVRRTASQIATPVAFRASGRETLVGLSPRASEGSPTTPREDEEETKENKAHTDTSRTYTLLAPPWSAAVCCPRSSRLFRQARATGIRRAARLFADRFNIARPGGGGGRRKMGTEQILTLRPESMTRARSNSVVSPSIPR